MQNFSFPIFKTKIDNLSQRFSLDDPVQRRRYFELKAGAEIEKLRDYLRENTFVGFLLGLKNSGKGTYSKLFAEAVGEDYVRHISIGDIVRAAHNDFRDEVKKKEIMDFLKRNYRGFISLNEAVSALLGRNTKTLLPAELILALIEKEIVQFGRKAVFIDGFPRNLDQISYSLYFRAIMGYRDDPDFFVFIDVPEVVIDERMKHRVICQKCQTPRNLKLLKTKKVGYDEKTAQFYLMCDNNGCGKERLVSKEGDELGVEPLRERIEADKKVITALLGLEGVSKIYLRNAVPVSQAKEYVDDYEITPSYCYKISKGEVQTKEELWVIKDDKGIESYSLLPAAIVVALIKQTAEALGL